MTRGRLTDERALSKTQLMLVHSNVLRRLARPLLPDGWSAGSFQTAGEVDTQRRALETLGARLAGLSIASFLCKCISSATVFFAGRQVEQSASVVFLVTVLSVQAVPSVVTLLLLHRFHFGSGGGDGRGSLMQSLLTRDGTAGAGASECGDRAAAAIRGEQAADDEAACGRRQERLELNQGGGSAGSN
jgi:hypothetical protein